MLTTTGEMISRLSLESLRAKEDILGIIEEAGRRDEERDQGWWLFFAYALLRDGWNAAEITEKIKWMVDENWTVMEQLVCKLAARSECGMRSANLCLNRVAWDLVECDLDNDRGLRMLCYLLGKRVEPKIAGKILRRLIFGLDEKRGWTDKIPWFGTGSVTRGTRRLKVVRVLLFWRFNDIMMSKFGRFYPLVTELVVKF